MVTENVRAVIYYLLVIIFTVFLWGTVLFLPKKEQVAYNCNMSEISPDFPPKAREECRKLRAESYKSDTTR